jgi:hypothetical protein
MEATGGKQPLRARRGKGNGDADSGSCGNAVQCLNSPAVFLAFVEIYEGAPPALWLQCKLRARVSGQNPSRIVGDSPGGLGQEGSTGFVTLGPRQILVGNALQSYAGA